MKAPNLLTWIRVGSKPPGRLGRSNSQGSDTRVSEGEHCPTWLDRGSCFPDSARNDPAIAIRGNAKVLKVCSRNPARYCGEFCPAVARSAEEGPNWLQHLARGCASEV